VSEIIDQYALSVARRQLSIAQREVKRLMQSLLQRKYSADQPRVEAGEPDGGQWTSDDGGSGPREGEGWRSAMASKRSEAFCERQFKDDIFHCKMVGLRACYAQAMERYSACLSGRQIPPLNY
jgi:hypothetical protein